MPETKSTGLALSDCIYGLRNLLVSDDEQTRIDDPGLIKSIGDLGLRLTVQDLVNKGEYDEAYEAAIKPTLRSTPKKEVLKATVEFVRDFVTEEDVEAMDDDESYLEKMRVDLIEEIMEEYEGLLTKWWEPDPDASRERVQDPHIIEERLDVVGMLTFLRAAQDRGLQQPKARFLTQDLKDVEVRLAGPRSAFPEGMEVRRGKTHIGTILPNGFVIGALAKDKQMIALLIAISEEPEEAARLYGETTNLCSFCNQPLTEASSQKNGYGPICAASYGLTWKPTT